MSKKRDILDAALHLFTENGARATSTKSIAIEAGVSEALIFKHFGSKDNLLEDIIKKGYIEDVKLTKNYEITECGKEFLIKFIDLPLLLVSNQFDFWRMQYKIMPLNPVAQQYHSNFMKPSKSRLIESFEILGYKEAAVEAEIILLLIDNIWKSLVSEKLTKQQCLEVTDLLKKKYSLI